MLSIEAQKQIETLKNNQNREKTVPSLDFPTRRKLYDERASKKITAENTKFSSDEIDNVSVEWIKIKKTTDKIILHIHGGAFCIGSSLSGRFMTSHIASLTNRNVLSINYRLAPEHPHPEGLIDCIKVYKWLLTQGYASKNISFLGESAGGALVLMLCAYCKENQLPLPGCICAISPSVDFTFSSPSIKKNVNSDLILDASLPKDTIANYFHEADPFNPVYSPIFGDLHDWPPVYFQTVRGEMLFDDSIRMYLKLVESNVNAELTVHEDLYHTFMLDELPESHMAFQQIACFILKY